MVLSNFIFPSSLDIYSYTNAGMFSSIYPALGITLKMFYYLLEKFIVYQILT